MTNFYKDYRRIMEATARVRCPDFYGEPVEHEPQPPSSLYFIGMYAIPVRHCVTISEIQRKVARRFDIPMAEMVSARRSREIARPRQVAMYLAKKLTPSSLPNIGRRFGGRDHTTVIHAVRTIEKLRTTDRTLDAHIRALAGQMA